MTPEVYAWVKEHRAKFNLEHGKTLDIGSMHINGSVRDLFSDYIGIDQFAGLNVDIVCNAHKLPFEDDFFDCVCCLEVLEHDTNFFHTIHEAHRVLKPGGYLFLTARGIGYERHDYPADFWRFTDDGFRLLLAGQGFETYTAAENLQGVFGWAQK